MKNNEVVRELLALAAKLAADENLADLKERLHSKFEAQAFLLNQLFQKHRDDAGGFGGKTEQHVTAGEFFQWAKRELYEHGQAKATPARLKAKMHLLKQIVQEQ